MEVENTLIRLREATAEINRATDDVRMKSILEKTWTLQDRLVFSNQVCEILRNFFSFYSLCFARNFTEIDGEGLIMIQRLDAASKNRIRSFGHIKLCGALHVCWSSKEGVQGRYMVCLLYPDVLCLASAGKADQIYNIQLCVGLASLKVEEVDNGRGWSASGGLPCPGYLSKPTTDISIDLRLTMPHGSIFLEDRLRM